MGQPVGSPADAAAGAPGARPCGDGGAVPAVRGSYDPQGWAGSGSARQATVDGEPGAFRAHSPAVGRPTVKGAPMAIKLLIADDHAYIRMALEGLFAGTDDISVVASCTDGDEGASTAARTEPDVVLMDLDMPRMNWLDATRKLLAAQPHVRVL